MDIAMTLYRLFKRSGMPIEKKPIGYTLRSGALLLKRMTILYLNKQGGYECCIPTAGGRFCVKFYENYSDPGKLIEGVAIVSRVLFSLDFFWHFFFQ